MSLLFKKSSNELGNTDIQVIMSELESMKGKCVSIEDKYCDYPRYDFCSDDFKKDFPTKILPKILPVLASLEKSNKWVTNNESFEYEPNYVEYDIGYGDAIGYVEMEYTAYPMDERDLYITIYLSFRQELYSDMVDDWSGGLLEITVDDYELVIRDSE